MASIAIYPTEQGKRWRVNWTERGHRRSRGGLKSAAGAERFRATIEERLERGQSAPVADDLPSDLRGYETWLRSKGDTEKHVAGTVALVSKTFAQCQWPSLLAVKGDSFSALVAELRGTHGYRAINAVIVAAKGFLRWAYRGAKIDTEPLKACTLLREQEDQRHPRRVISDSEIAALLESAPPERAILYRTAMGTGLRQNELRSLCIGSFRLEDDPPVVEVQAAYSKRRRTDRQPLPPELLEALRPFLAGRDPTEVAFARCTIRTFKADLLRAGIAYVVGRYPFLSGEGYFDFHSLRHVYGTRLAEAGVDPASIQALMRHSTPTLTQRYTHMTVRHLAGQVAKLAEPGITVCDVKAKEGAA